jgi:hypothetical protein
MSHPLHLWSSNSRNGPKVNDAALEKPGYMLETPCIRRYSLFGAVKMRPVRTISREVVPRD